MLNIKIGEIIFVQNRDQAHLRLIQGEVYNFKSISSPCNIVFTDRRTDVVILVYPAIPTKLKKPFITKGIMKWYHLNWTIKWDKKKSVYDMVMGVLVVHAIMSQFALWWKHYLYNSIWFLYLVHLTTPGNTSLFLKYRISPVFKWMAAVKEYWKRFKCIYFFFGSGISC